jgi:hypothetical protein
MVFVLIFVPATDPVGTWRLSQRHEQAPGWVERAEATMYHEGGDEDSEGTPVYRYDYTFRLPDGNLVKGSSYALGQQLALPAAAPGQPGPRVQVTVEYDPQNPGISRVQGMRTSPYTAGALFVVIFPAIGLAIALGGLASGRRRARLLRDGEVVAATITGCRLGAGDDSTFLAPAEFKNRMCLLRAGFVGHPFQIFARGFVGVWTALAAVFLVGGTAFCVVALVTVFLFPGPLPPRERGLFALGICGFLVVWLTVGVYMVRQGWQGCRAAGKRALLDSPLPATCTFEFSLPDGEIVRARGPGRLAEPEGVEPPQAALYDPRRPGGALLVSSLWPEMRAAEGGGWETSTGAEAVVRLLLALVLLAAPLVAWALLR